MATSREVVVQHVAELPELRALGLPEDAVFQADTLESPNFFPFIVVRWLEEVAGIGPVSQRPAEFWVYDAPGDYDRAIRIGKTLIDSLVDWIPRQTEGGWVSQFMTQGINLGRGLDMYDDGYDAVVIPYRVRAIASGL